jgi:hypothetical protein
MPTHLHLLKADSTPLAASVIAEVSGRPHANVTVVVLDDSTAPSLPAAVRLLRLGEDGLDYAALLDLIFAADHVAAW